MALLASAAAAAWGGGELFSYNRENFMFDKDSCSMLLPSPDAKPRGYATKGDAMAGKNLTVRLVKLST